VRDLLEGDGLPTADLTSAPGLQLWVLEEGASPIRRVFFRACATRSWIGNPSALP
jgi:hypothetical protein